MVSRAAVFSPEKEKSQPGRPCRGWGKEKRLASPCSAACAKAGPPGKPKHFCHLVEGLARRVVDRAAESPVMADSFRQQKLGVTA